MKKEFVSERTKKLRELYSDLYYLEERDPHRFLDHAILIKQLDDALDGDGGKFSELIKCILDMSENIDGLKGIDAQLDEIKFSLLTIREKIPEEAL